MRWPWSRRAASTPEATGADRKGASDAYRAAQGQSGDVARAVEAAASAAKRTDRFIREVERSLHLRGTT